MELIVIYETGGIGNVKLDIDTADMGSNLCTKTSIQGRHNCQITAQYQ